MGIVLKLRTGRMEVRIPVGLRDCAKRQKGPQQLWGPYSLLFNGYRRPFGGVKRPGRGVGHSPPPSAKVKNE